MFLTIYIGICAKFVKQAADIGAKVIAADLALNDDSKKLFEGNSNIAFQKTDVAKWEDLHELVKAAKEKFGSTPDVYVAGAGVFEPVRRSLEVDRADTIPYN